MNKFDQEGLLKRSRLESALPSYFAVHRADEPEWLARFSNIHKIVFEVALGASRALHDYPPMWWETTGLWLAGWIEEHGLAIGCEECELNLEIARLLAADPSPFSEFVPESQRITSIQRLALENHLASIKSLHGAIHYTPDEWVRNHSQLPVESLYLLLNQQIDPVDVPCKSCRTELEIHSRTHHDWEALGLSIDNLAF